MRLTLLLITAAACTPAADPTAMLALTATTDLQELSQRVRSTVDAAKDLRSGTGPVSSSLAGVGDCSWSLSLDGDDRGGMVRVGLATRPCGGPTGAIPVDWALEEGSLDGSWKSSDFGEIELSLVGYRAAEVEEVGSNGHPYDASWTVHELSIYVDDRVDPTWSASMSYSSFAGTMWVMAVRGQAGLLEGKLDGGVDGTCFIGGTEAEPVLNCE